MCSPGQTDESNAEAVAEAMRDDIAALDDISQVSVNYARPWEISIEISEFTLRQYGLTLEAVSQAIRAASLDMPGGSIKTAGGEILIRSQGQVYRGIEYADIEILTLADGTALKLDDIAEAKDAFQEGFLKAKYNGDPAVTISVYRVGDEDTITSADAVKNYIEEQRRTLPSVLISMSSSMNQSLSIAASMRSLKMPMRV